MVQIKNEIATTFNNSNASNIPKNATIKILGKLPSSLEGKLINATVSEKINGDKYKLTLPTGKTIEANIEPAVKVGSKISFIILKNSENKITSMVLAELKENLPNLDKNNDNKKQQIINKEYNEEKGLLNKSEKQQPTSKNYITSKDIILNDKVSGKHNDIQKLIGKKIPITNLNKQPITNIRNEITVVISKNNNELQILKPQNTSNIIKTVASSNKTNINSQNLDINKNIPTLQTKLPINLPEGTVLKLSVTEKSAKIIDIKTQDNNKTNNIKTTDENELKTETKQKIILTSKSSNFKNPLPINSIIKVTAINSSKKLPDLTKEVISKDKQINTETIPQFKTIAISDGGEKVSITSQVNIIKGSEMTIKITSVNGAEILQVGYNKNNNEQNSSNEQNNNNKKNEPILKINNKYSGTITEQRDNGKLILTLNDGNKIEIQSKQFIPVGAKVTIKISENNLAKIISSEIPQELAKVIALTNLSKTWKTLNYTLKTLNKSNPKEEVKLKNNLPNLSKETFLPNLINFIDAVNNKSTERLAKNETANLLKALGIDFSIDLNNLHATTQKTTNTPENWRSLFFPYLENNDNEPKQGGFFWHNSEDKQGKINSTRFIVHLELSNIGPVQLDGLMQEKNINLKLKSSINFNNSEEKGIKSIVRQTLEKLNLSGNIKIVKQEVKTDKPLNLVTNKTSQFKVII